MSNDIDPAIDRLTPAQKEALASILSAKMTADRVKRAAEAKPGEAAFTTVMRLKD